jgi:hypothetical protein
MIVHYLLGEHRLLIIKNFLFSLATISCILSCISEYLFLAASNLEVCFYFSRSNYESYSDALSISCCPFKQSYLSNLCYFCPFLRTSSSL